MDKPHWITKKVIFEVDAKEDPHPLDAVLNDMRSKEYSVSHFRVDSRPATPGKRAEMVAIILFERLAA